jgi:hypothetical protein
MTKILFNIVFLFSAFTYAADQAQESVEKVSLPTSKSISIEVNPFSLLLGEVSGNVNIALGRKITFGPYGSFFSYKIGDGGWSGFGFGARANIYLTGDAISDSWYFGPGAGYKSITLGSDSLGSITVSGLAIYGLIGYHWVWNNGINLRLGGGASYSSIAAKTSASNGSSITVPGSGLLGALEFSFGFAF